VCCVVCVVCVVLCVVCVFCEFSSYYILGCLVQSSVRLGFSYVIWYVFVVLCYVSIQIRAVQLHVEEGKTNT